jgi:hypothetical protein
MRRLTITLIALAGILSFIPAARCQTFGSTGTTNISVTVAAEASLYVSTATTALTSGGTLFSDYTGTTNLLYKIRTSKGAGTGNIQAQVTTDFSPTGGPLVATPPTTGDTLSYSCTVSTPGTACDPGQIASTTSGTPVVSFSADARSARAGNSGSVSWTLTNDPQYKTGPYSATVTFTVSAT